MTRRMVGVWVGLTLILITCVAPVERPAPTPSGIGTGAPTALWPHPSISRPLPEPEALINEYRKVYVPLIDRLQAAGPLPEHFPVPDPTRAQVVLVPLNERLFPVQEILFPDWRLGNPEASSILYVAYDYRRGVPLGRDSGFPSDTQEILVRVRLVVREDNRWYRVEEKEGIGGSGSISLAHMVRHAVGRLDSLGEAGGEVEAVLETIIGYAAGLDGDPSLPLERRRTVLIWALESPYWADRKSAVMALEKLGPEAQEAIPALVQVLGDETPDVRRRAVRALGDIGPEAIPALTLALRDEDPRIRKYAIWELGKIGPEAVPALTELLRDGDPEIRRHAVWALGDIGREGVPALIRALEDENPEVRWAAAWTLGEVGPKAAEAVPALIQTLRDEGPEVRRASAWALGAIGVRETAVVAALIQTLIADEDPTARRLAAWALGALQPDWREGVPALIQALGDSDPGVRRTAARVLQRVTGQDFGQDARRWQCWWEQQQSSEGGNGG